MNDLATDAGSRFQVAVLSAAQPAPELLLVLRSAIQRDTDLQGLFLRFREEKQAIQWLRDMLALQAIAHVPKDIGGRMFGFSEVMEACQYLADEYNQLGEGYFIVSTETGRVEFVVSEDDLYDPGLQARDSGALAQALRRIKPDLASAFVMHTYQAAREEQSLAALAERLGPESSKATVLWDIPQLRIATRKGRRSLAKELSQETPLDMLRRVGGPAGRFAQLFQVIEDTAPDGDLWFEGVAVADSTLAIPDEMALNFLYDPLTSLRHTAPRGWLRHIARSLCSECYARSKTPATVARDLEKDDLPQCDLWIASPDESIVLKLLGVHNVFPVEGAQLLGLSSNVGTLGIGSEFQVESREVSSRWTVLSSLAYSLSLLDLQNVCVLPLVGVPVNAVVDH